MADWIVSQFYEFLDPFEYHLGFKVSHGMPTRIWANMASMNISTSTLDRINIVCRCFKQLTPYKFGEPDCYELPQDWKNKRAEIEGMYPYRRILLKMIREELEHCTEDLLTNQDYSNIGCGN